MTLRFAGQGNTKPQTQARRYVWNVMIAMLENEFNHPDCIEGWMFGGIENEVDRRRLTKAIKAEIAALQRRISK